MEYKIINLSYLDGVADGDIDVIKELVQIFMDQLPEFTVGFNESIKSNDWINIAAIAHKAKSSVVSMGMDELGNNDLKNLELVAKQSRISELEKLVVKSECEEDELVTLKRNLEDYPAKRIDWVKDNSDFETIQRLINKFNAVCSEALNELNDVLKS